MIEEIVTFIKSHKKVYIVKRICKVLKFPRNMYYKALLRAPSNREKEAECLKFEIYKIWKGSKRRYGAPKTKKVLESRGKGKSKTFTTLHVGIINTFD